MAFHATKKLRLRYFGEEKTLNRPCLNNAQCTYSMIIVKECWSGGHWSGSGVWERTENRRWIAVHQHRYDCWIAVHKVCFLDKGRLFTRKLYTDRYVSWKAVQCNTGVIAGNLDKDRLFTRKLYTDRYVSWKAVFKYRFV